MSETRQLAVVSETELLDFEEVAVGTAALQRKVLEHFSEHWNLSAIVNAYRQREEVPTHYWPIMIVDHVPSIRSALASRKSFNKAAKMRAEALHWQIDDLRSRAEGRG